MLMKKISVLIPCFNETDNVIPMSEAVVNEFHTQLPGYDYELVFIDNDSTDGTKEKLEQICAEIQKLKRFSMQKILGSLIPLFMGSARRRETVRLISAAISRIQWILFRALSMSGRKDIKL